MRVVCIHIPRGGSSDPVSDAAGALYMTKTEALPERAFWHQIDDLAESIWQPFSLEYYCADNVIHVCMAGDDAMIDYLTTGVYTWLGGSEVHDLGDYTLQTTPNTVAVGTDMKLWRPHIYPLLNYRDLKISPIVPIFVAMSNLPAGDRILTQLIVRPLRDTSRLHLMLLMDRVLERFVRKLRPRNWFRQGLPNTTLERIRFKCLSHLFMVNYRISAFAEAPEGADSATTDAIAERLSKHVTGVAEACRYYNSADENRILMGPIERGPRFLSKVQKRSFIRPFMISTPELVTMFHPPGGGVPNAAQVLSRKAPAPLLLPTTPGDPDICFLGHTTYRDMATPFGVRRFDRRRHLYTIGKSGSGKSCLLQLLIKNDIEQGFGCAVLDPHGDLVDDVLKFIPRERASDVVIFDPSDSGFAPSFNPMQPAHPDLKSRVTLSFLDAFRRVFAGDWSERMDHVLRYAMLALVNLPGANITSLRQLLCEESYRLEVVRQASDESVKRFWLREFPARAKELEGPVSRLLNRLDELLSMSTLRQILGQPKNLFDFREFMDSRKIVLLKISKGVLGSENSELLGTLLIWKIYEAAMSRADIPPEQREDFYFYIDEFQNFATESLGEILSESRKYRLCLTLANQFLGQLPAAIRGTVFGNITNLLSFRVGADDAGLVSRELAPRFGTEDVVNLGLREFYLKMSIQGEVQEAFSGRTLDVSYLPPEERCVAECIDSSRRKYCIQLEGARKRSSAPAQARVAQAEPTPEQQP